jgi:hypothetical protein
MLYDMRGRHMQAPIDRMVAIPLTKKRQRTNRNISRNRYPAVTWRFPVAVIAALRAIADRKHFPSVTQLVDSVLRDYVEQHRHLFDDQQNK